MSHCSMLLDNPPPLLPGVASLGVLARVAVSVSEPLTVVTSSAGRG